MTTTTATPTVPTTVYLNEAPASFLGFNRAGNSGADDDSRGALGLLWVEQGQSFQLGSPAETARRTLIGVYHNLMRQWSET